MRNLKLTVASLSLLCLCGGAVHAQQVASADSLAGVWNYDNPYPCTGAYPTKWNISGRRPDGTLIGTWQVGCINKSGEFREGTGPSTARQLADGTIEATFKTATYRLKLNGRQMVGDIDGRLPITLVRQ